MFRGKGKGKDAAKTVQELKVDSKLPENLVPLANKIKQLRIQSYPSTA
jgi:hypothetical protein